MPTYREWEAQIKRYSRAELIAMCEQILEGEGHALSPWPDGRRWEPGRAFEYLVVRAFELDGADVRYPYLVDYQGATIEQIDGVAYAGGLACMIESKDQAARVGYEPIAKLRSQLSRRPISVIGSVFSRSGFTDPTYELARFTPPQPVLLWQGPEVLYCLRNELMVWGLVTKYRIFVEQAAVTGALYEVPRS